MRVDRLTDITAMPSKRKGKGKSKVHVKRGRAGARGGVTSGFTRGHSALAGQEDAEFTTHRYEYSAGVTATGGAVSYIQIKGNSIYRPYVGNTDSVGGYARMYTQYSQSLVISSSIRVTCAGDAATGTKGGWRIAIVPCSPSAYTVYSAFSNAAQLRDVPHSREAFYSVGSRPASCTGSGTTQALLLGTTDKAESLLSSTSAFFGSTGADPSALWYYAVAIQPMEPITDLCSLNFAITFKVKWYKPIATAIQVSINRWGNEETPETKESKNQTDLKLQRTSAETKSVDTAGYSLQFADDPGPESSDPSEVLFRKMLAARLGTVQMGAGAPKGAACPAHKSFGPEASRPS